MRQDPKAFPRNPNQSAEDGAELATNTLRYALGWEWNDRVRNDVPGAGRSSRRLRP